MDCFFCKQEYEHYDLVLTSPVLCPFCVLGHGNILNVSKTYKSENNMRKAVEIIRKPSMLHRLRCIVPSK